MPILKVACMGHPVLREKAREIAPEELGSPELAGFIDDLIETMQEYAGVGLAAPQVHEGLRLFVMQTDPDDEATLRVVVNPKLTALGAEGWEDWEGCLSIPDIHGRVPRNDRVRELLFTGDFVMVPPRFVMDLEGSLRGAPSGEIAPLVSAFFAESPPQIATAPPEAFAGAVAAAFAAA